MCVSISARFALARLLLPVIQIAPVLLEEVCVHDRVLLQVLHIDSPERGRTEGAVSDLEEVILRLKTRLLGLLRAAVVADVQQIVILDLSCYI